MVTPLHFLPTLPENVPVVDKKVARKAYANDSEQAKPTTAMNYQLK